MSDPVSARFVFYLEGVRAPFHKVAVRFILNGVGVMSVDVSYDKREGLIRKLQPKTLGHLFFIDAAGVMRFIAEGELLGKAYSRDAAGLVATLNFTAVGANYQSAHFALLPSETDGPIVAGGITNPAGMITAGQAEVLGGGTVAPQVVAPPVGDLDYKATQLLSDLAGAFASGGGEFDYPAAFSRMFKKYLAPSGTTVQGAEASVFLKTADARFDLAGGFAGATDKELADLFFGQGAESGGSKEKTEQFLGAIFNRIQGPTDLLMVMRTIAAYSYHNLTDIPCPPLVEGADGNTVLPRMMVFPNLFVADPPVCNLFLPHMVGNIGYGVQCVKPTRLLTLQKSHEDKLLSPLSIATLLPRTLSDKVFPPGAGAASMNMAGVITKEEISVGVNLAIDQDIYPSNRAVSVENMRAWMQKTGDLRFYAQRNAGQNAVVSMDFNPYPVPGLPGAFADKELGQGRGLVTAVEHTATPKSGTTQVMMGCCCFSGDAVENTEAVADVQDGYNHNLDSFANGTVSEVYEKTLKVESLTKAAARFMPTANAAPAPAAGPVTQETARDVFGVTTPDFGQFGTQTSTPAPAGFGKTISIDDALRSLVEVLSASDNESARAAEVEFVSRPIATYGEMVVFYGQNGAGDHAAAPSDAPALENAPDAPEGSVLPEIDIANRGSDASQGNVPDILEFAKPFLISGDRLVTTQADGKDGSAPLVGSESGAFFADRRTPVLEYLKALEQ